MAGSIKALPMEDPEEFNTAQLSVRHSSLERELLDFNYESNRVGLLQVASKSKSKCQVKGVSSGKRGLTAPRTRPVASRKAITT